MHLKPQQYWAIIITLLFHAVLFWFLFFSEMHRLREEKVYELEFETQNQKTTTEDKHAKIEELAKQQLNEILSNRPSKRAVSNEDILQQETPDELQESFEKRRLQTKRIRQQKATAKITLSQQKERVNEETDEKAPQTVFYVGKSSVEYFLAERYRVKLPIPVYQCEGGGKVEVAIVVNRQGMVVKAEIIKERSRFASSCMQEAALNAALTSSFSERAEALVEQKGRIVYQFAAQ